MTGVEPPPTAPETERRCPRCGSPLGDEQEWCLHCGAAVGSRIVPAPGWRIPVVVVGVLLAVIVAAVAIAIVQLADDTEPVPQTATASATASPATPGTTPTPVPTTIGTPTPSPGLTPTPEGEATPGVTPTATVTPVPTATPSTDPNGDSGTGTTGGIASWTPGKSGWTVVIASVTSRAAADTRAQQLIDGGATGVGVLRSDDYSSLRKGYWVVYSGEYGSRQAASDALQGVDAPDAYVRQITPR
jgi:septal ring-binding cell division protein DamX